MPDRVVITGEVVPPSGALQSRPRHLPRRHDIRDSPLWDWDGGHGLAGRIVTDAAEIAEIAARVAYYSRPVWLRWWAHG